MNKQKSHITRNPSASANIASPSTPPPRVSSNISLVAKASESTSRFSSPFHPSPGTQTPSRLSMLFQNRVKGGMTSPATKRLKSDTSLPTVYVWSITCDGAYAGTAIDGLYSAYDFLAGYLTNEQLARLAPPFDKNVLLRRLDVPGGTLKASEAINILKEQPKDSPIGLSVNQDLTDLENNATYMVSQTGKKRGSSKVWLFTVLQLIELQPESTNVDFEQDVFNVITNFLAKTRRTCDKDNFNKICIPESVEEARQLYEESPMWNIKHLTFDLDTDYKLEVFDKLAASI